MPSKPAGASLVSSFDSSPRRWNKFVALRPRPVVLDDANRFCPIPLNAYRTNPKSEFRNPKQSWRQINLKSGKSKTPNLKEACLAFYIFWSFEIVSNFGFRASNYCPWCLCIASTKFILGVAKGLSACFVRRLASVVPAVERIGIFPQDLFFGALRDILAPADRRNHIGKQRIPMRIIGGENDAVFADPLDDVGKHLFFRLGGEKPIAMSDILAGLLLAQRRFHVAALLPFLVHALHPVGNPTGAAFEKRDPQLGKLFRDAGIHQTHALNDSFR